MSIDYIKSSFGFHSVTDVAPEIKGKVLAFNIANGTGYIPGIGAIIGIARIIFFWRLMEKKGGEMGDLDKKICRLQILRGAVEAVGLGVCYFSADLLVTIERNQSKIQPPEETPTTESRAEDEVEDAASVVGYEETLYSDLIESWENRFSMPVSSENV